LILQNNQKLLEPFGSNNQNNNPNLGLNSNKNKDIQKQNYSIGLAFYGPQIIFRNAYRLKHHKVIITRAPLKTIYSLWAVVPLIKLKAKRCKNLY